MAFTLLFICSLILFSYSSSTKLFSKLSVIQAMYSRHCFIYCIFFRQALLGDLKCDKQSFFRYRYVAVYLGCLVKRNQSFV